MPYSTTALLIVAAMAGVLCSARSVRATSAVHRSFPELIQRAEVIAVGRVTDVSEQWDAATRSPYTLVTLSSLTVLKGEASETLTLRFFGGHTPDGYVVAIEGTPRFTVGESTIVFSAGNNRDAIPLVGLWQGLLRAEFDRRIGATVVRNHAGVPITGIRDGELVMRSSDAGAPDTEALEVPPLSLSTLIDQIRQEVSSGAGR